MRSHDEWKYAIDGSVKIDQASPLSTFSLNFPECQLFHNHVCMSIEGTSNTLASREFHVNKWKSKI